MALPASTDGDDTRRLSRRLMVIGLVVVALVAVYGAFVGLRDAVYSPEQPVRALFAALASRDGQAAAGVAPCGAPLCRPGGLASGYRPPENLQILDVTYGSATRDDPTRRPDNSRASVHVRYTIDGTSYDDYVGVQRGNQGLLRDWGISNPPGAYLDIVSLTVSSVRLAGAEVETLKAPAAGKRTDGAVFALPGSYTLTEVDNPLLAVEQTQILVAGADVGRQRIDVQVSIKPAAVGEVDKQIRARVDACAKQDTMRPTVGESLLSNCYFSHSTKYVYTDKVHWTVVDYPKVRLRLSDDPTSDTHEVLVETTTPGHATITYQYSTDVLEPRRWTPTSDTSEISPRGIVVVDAGKIVWVS